MAIFLITFSTESNHKGEGRWVGQKPPNFDYVIHGWSLSSSLCQDHGQSRVVSH